MNSELSRLVELMPASGRMYCKISSDLTQAAVIQARFPRPGQEIRSIRINLTLWQQLTQAQQDLLLLQTVSWLISIRWFQPGLYSGLTAIGTVLTTIELLQFNAAGIVTFGGLTTVAAMQIWRQNRSDQMQLLADEKAVQIAQRRGYSQPDAVHALITAIEAIAQIEQRSLSVTELLRCQKLQASTSFAALGRVQ